MGLVCRMVSLVFGDACWGFSGGCWMGSILRLCFFFLKWYIFCWHSLNLIEIWIIHNELLHGWWKTCDCLLRVFFFFWCFQHSWIGRNRTLYLTAGTVKDSAVLNDIWEGKVSGYFPSLLYWFIWRIWNYRASRNDWRAPFPPPNVLRGKKKISLIHSEKNNTESYGNPVAQNIKAVMCTESRCCQRSSRD